MKGMGVGLGRLPQEVTLETRAEGLGREISRKGTPGGGHSKRQSPRGGNQLKQESSQKGQEVESQRERTPGFYLQGKAAGLERHTVILHKTAGMV